MASLRFRWCFCINKMLHQSLKRSQTVVMTVSAHLVFCQSSASVLPVQKKKSITVQHANECKTKSETIDFTNSITKCIRRRPIQKFLRSRMLTETKIELIYHFKPMFLKYMNIFIKGHEQCHNAKTVLSTKKVWTECNKRSKLNAFQKIVGKKMKMIIIHQNYFVINMKCR